MSDPRADALRAGYASVAHGYRTALLDELVGKPLDRAFLDAFAERCAGGRIVEVGCGPGQVAAYLAARGAEVEGTDLSPQMILEARAAHGEASNREASNRDVSSRGALTFREADMFALPYADASLRGLVAFYAIVHAPTAELARPFAEWRRVLAPEGLVAIAFHIGSEHVHVDELFGAATSLDFFFHPTDAVIGALDGAGFVLEARLERAPYAAEHPTKRAYLLARAR